MSKPNLWHMLLLLVVAACNAALIPPASAAEEPFGGTALCRNCHDFAPAEHVDKLLMGSHGISKEAGFERGCEDCHGPSGAHAEAPREHPPGNSFGPRWSTGDAARDSACLACHEENIAANWQHALHMHNNLTCITCHDIHSEGDKVLLPEQQAAVCTECHKAQTTGMHGLGGNLAEQPACSSCHDPHNHETAQPKMLANDSMGCKACHDLELMVEDPLLPAKTRDYHVAAQQPGQTCLACHKGIAHGAEQSAPLTPANVPAKGE